MILIYTYKSFKSPNNVLWGQPIEVNSKNTIQNIQFKKKFRLAVHMMPDCIATAFMAE